jgi:alkyl hydroperoxide reductase subunit AhpC
VPESTEGTSHSHKWAGQSWVVLFSHARGITPVCTAELGTVAKHKGDFQRRNVKVIGLSADPLPDQLGCSQDIEEAQGVRLNFTLLADGDRKVSHLHDMIHPEASDTFMVRWLLVIAPSVSNDEAPKLFPTGFQEFKPRARTAPQPIAAARA